ncbi:MAG: chorismate lyase [Gammaproteobacteria bacterium]|nr:chorismate lyase [Gammaproteobacteria bacterium]
MNHTNCYVLGTTFRRFKYSEVLPALLAITGSMTKALQDAAQSECHMNVQNESWQIPWTDELNDLPPMTTPYWIRETILIVKHPALFARAVFPKEFTEHFPDIFELGTRPLGQLIFTNNRFQRSNIRIAKMSGQCRHYPKKFPQH